MKDTPQDPQTFDAAFDERCRDLLQSRSVPAPDFVEPVPPASGHSQRLALVAGAVIAIGIGAALWPSGQPEALEAPVQTPAPAMTTAEPTLHPEAPAMESPAAESTTVVHSTEEAVAQPKESVAVAQVQEETVIAPAQDVSATETAASLAESEGSSPDMDPVSSTKEATESIADPTVDAVENAESAESTFFRERAESAQGAPTDSPSEEPGLPAMEEPALAPEPANESQEPTLRLPLTLPAGGGQ